MFESHAFFSLMFWFVPLVFVLFLGYALINFLLNLSAEPQTVQATLIGKDQTVSQNGDHHHSSYTFIFEVEAGERMSLDVKRSVYHQYVVGDRGQLTYQRKWLKEFVRE